MGLMHMRKSINGGRINTVLYWDTADTLEWSEGVY